MDLKEKLRLLKAARTRNEVDQDSTEVDQAPSDVISDPVSDPTSDPIPAPVSAPSSNPISYPETEPRDPLAILGGRTIQTSQGAAYVVERSYSAFHYRGCVCLADAHRMSAEPYVCLCGDDRLGGMNLSRSVFFDTETTGLGVGAGTYVFLVGLGSFRDDQFIIRQYFLRDYGEEPAFLEAVEADLRRFDSLVSFNGKSFDVHLLQNRWIMNGSRFPLDSIPHLDLLHPAQRLWRERLESCSLGSLEEAILGTGRTGDVPGYLIPALYFRYLDIGDAESLLPVFEHNRLDILSLVALGVVMGRRVSDPIDWTLPGLDLFSLGRLHESRGNYAESIQYYEAALEADLPESARGKVLHRLSMLHKRLRQHEEAHRIWLSLVEHRGSYSLFPYIELAKYYEHRLKDPASAREVVLKAVEVVSRRRSVTRSDVSARAAVETDLQDLYRRLARLESKLRRASGFDVIR